MRFLLFWLLLGLGAAHAQVTGMMLRGEPFKPETIPITWSVPATNVPVGLWIYKVVPQQFSPVVVSNLIEIGGFTSKDKKTPKDSPFKEKSALYFESQDGKRHLGISSALGFVEYKDEDVIAEMKEPVDGVPDEDEAMRSALQLLHRSAIDTSQLAIKPSGDLRFYRTMARRGKMNKKTGEDIKEVISRGVSFIRRIDRADFTGIGNAGGFSVVFGNNGKIAELQMVWRGIEPYRSIEIVPPERFVQWIKEGRSVITEMEPLRLNWGEVKKLTIANFTPYYMGESGDEIQRYIIPFADFEVEAELPTTNVTFRVSCPLAE